MDRRALGQSLNLSDAMVAAGRPNRPGTPMRPRMVTVHNTSNTGNGANAAAHGRFITKTGFYTLPSGKKNQVSWHYTVDDVQVLKHVPINERAWHAGPGNVESIAIEVCMHKNIDQAAANARAARLVAVLLHDLKLDRAAIRSHKSWTGKACPVLLLPDWNGFLDEVDAILAAITPTDTESLLGDETVTLAEMLAIAQPLPESPMPDDSDIEIDHQALADALK